MPPPFHIKPDEYEKENCKAPKGRSSVAEQRQRNADNRYKSHSHSYIYEEMHEETACYTVAVDTGKAVFLPFAQHYQAGDEEHVDCNYQY